MSVHNRTWLEVVSRVMNVGMLLVGSDGNLDFANAQAAELLGCSDEAEVQRRWGRLRTLLGVDGGFDTACGLGPETRPRRSTVDLPQEQGMRFLRLEIHAGGAQGCDGRLVLLRDRQAGDILETDLLLASRMRSLVHVYRVLAHDLKAPLNAMQLTLELLADAGRPDAASRRRRHIEVLSEELARLNRILQTMLDQKEPLESVPQVFDLREVCREIVVLLAPQARGQRVDLRVRVPEHSLLLRGYRDRLKQALLNIVINGLEAMPTGGRLAMDVEPQAAEVRVRVSDTGSGISETLLDEIHQIYFTTKNSGSGIGLYVARLVVESHGGRIGVENERGIGACFTVSLPLCNEVSSASGVAAGGFT